ncbi:MAG: hypothetical protein NE330_17885 [Lentisphaeraceae bacterium]|nr:hypothetical protein [Lentisphaeraceae bacterium]
MIHHFSLNATDTKKVADVLAEVLGGQVTGFRPTENAYMVWFGDEHGSAIEIYPKDTHLVPKDKENPCAFEKEVGKKYTGLHAAISVDRTREELQAIADREGWHAAEFSRGSFGVYEFWLENELMIEFLTSDMAADYLKLAEKYKKGNS